RGAQARARCADSRRRETARPRARGPADRPRRPVRAGQAQRERRQRERLPRTARGDRRERQGPGPAAARQVPRAMGRRHYAGLRRELLSVIVVSGTFRLPPGRIAEARAAMRTVIAASLAEAGCRTYSYAEDVTEPGLFRVYEEWDS